MRVLVSGFNLRHASTCFMLLKQSNTEIRDRHYHPALCTNHHYTVCWVQDGGGGGDGRQKAGTSNVASLPLDGSRRNEVGA